MGRFRRGRGPGRGRGNNNNNNSGNNNSNKPQKGQIPDEKLKFSIGTNQAENYQRLKKYLVRQVQSKYGSHVASILLEEAETPVPMPQLQMAKLRLSDKPSAEEKALVDHEQKQIEKQFDHEMDAYEKKKSKIEFSKEKVCPMLIDKCSPEVISKLEEDAEYNKYQLNDPLKLLLAIKDICLNYRRAKYPADIVGEYCMLKKKD